MEKLYELKNQRAALIDMAEKAVNSGDMDGYSGKMSEITKLNQEISALEDIAAERGRFDKNDAQMVSRAEQQQNKKEAELTQNRLSAARSGNEYAQAFVKAMKSGAKVGARSEELEPLYNAMTISGGTPEGSDGGFLVPVEFDNMIHRKMKEFVRLADYFNVENVSGYSGWRAVETTASRKPLALVEEAAEIGKKEQPSFKRVDYQIKKYGDRIAISRELLSDNTAGLLQYMADWFAPRVVLTENSLLLALIGGLAAKNFTAGKEIKELKSVLNRELNTAISRNAVILTNGNGYDFLDQQVDANGRGLLTPNPADPDVYRFKTRPVIAADADLIPSRTVTTAGATKGDYDPLYIGYFKAFGTLFRREALEFATTDVGGDAWATATPELRGIVRLDAQKIDEDAAVKREIFTPSAS